MDAPEGVAEGGIHDDAVAAVALHGEFGFKRPAALAGGGAEEVEEGLVDGGFAGDVVLVELAPDLGFQVVVGVLGLPKAVDAPEGVAEGGVHDDPVAAVALHGEFGFEGPAALAGGGAEEVEEGLADGGFAGDAVLVKLGEGGVVGLD